MGSAVASVVLSAGYGQLTFVPMADALPKRPQPPDSSNDPPQLAGFCGCVSVSADGLDAIVGSLALGRDPLPDVGSPPLGRLD